MLAHDHVDFIGPARGVRDIRCDLLALIHEPTAILELASQQRTWRAAAEAPIRLQLQFGHRRQERVGVNLAVGMMQRHADLHPAILEDKHVVHILARPELQVEPLSAMRGRAIVSRRKCPCPSFR